MLSSRDVLGPRDVTGIDWTFAREFLDEANTLPSIRDLKGGRGHTWRCLCSISLRAFISYSIMAPCWQMIRQSQRLAFVQSSIFRSVRGILAKGVKPLAKLELELFHKKDS